MTTEQVTPEDLSPEDAAAVAMMGQCPICHQPGETYAVDNRNIWAYCAKHRVRWYATTYFAGDSDSSDLARWAENRAMLEQFDEVDRWSGKPLVPYFNGGALSDVRHEEEDPTVSNEADTLESFDYRAQIAALLAPHVPAPEDLAELAQAAMAGTLRAAWRVSGDRPIDLWAADNPLRAYETFTDGSGSWTTWGLGERGGFAPALLPAAVAARRGADFPEQDIANASAFGACPICGKISNAHTDYKVHWGYCERHRVRWSTGYGLISVPDEFNNEAFYEANRAMLDEFDEVEPWYPSNRLAALPL